VQLAAKAQKNEKEKKKEKEKRTTAIRAVLVCKVVLVYQTEKCAFLPYACKMFQY